MTKFIPVAVAIVAFGASLTSAFAHTEFRDRDSLQAQGATGSFSQAVAAQALSQAVVLSDAESITILHNVSKDDIR